MKLVLVDPDFVKHVLHTLNYYMEHELVKLKEDWNSDTGFAKPTKSACYGYEDYNKLIEIYLDSKGMKIWRR